MAKYRYIKDSFWTDPYIEKLSPDYKLVFLYLLTNPQCNVGGVYEIRIKRIAYETGYDVEVIENILKRFEDDGKIITWNDWLYIVNFTKNQADNPAIQKGILRIYSELPEELQIIIRGGKINKIKKYKNNLHNSRKDEVKKRDGFKCVMCGNTEDLHIDHIKPLFLGGSNHLENLRTLCRKCNLGRNKDDYDINEIYIESDRVSEDSKNPVELGKVKLSKVYINKEKLGEFSNVLLTQEELEKLNKAFGEPNTKVLIEELSSYMASKRKSYSSHYATLLNWGRRKIQSHQEKLQPKNRTIV